MRLGLSVSALSISCTYHLDISLDPGFKEFYSFCKANDIPVVIISRSVSLHTSASTRLHTSTAAWRLSSAPSSRS